MLSGGECARACALKSEHSTQRYVRDTKRWMILQPYPGAVTLSRAKLIRLSSARQHRKILHGAGCDRQADGTRCDDGDGARCSRCSRLGDTPTRARARRTPVDNRKAFYYTLSCASCSRRARDGDDAAAAVWRTSISTDFIHQTYVHTCPGARGRRSAQTGLMALDSRDAKTRARARVCPQRASA